uniref:BED-type domain-containing protein n=1 Tax=Chenopodium quinoa TaxID=63459 RepID=A0A803MZQ8_CHEQI
MANSPNPDEPIDLPDSDSDDEVSDSHQTESKKKTSNVTSLNKPGINFKRQRKLTSDVWANFEFLDKPDEQGNIICMCKKCGQKYNAESRQGTGNLKRHIKKCKKRTFKDVGQMIIDSSSFGSMMNRVPTFDYDIVREMLSIAVVKHDLPFQFAEYSAVRKLINYINPDVKLVSRNTLKADVLKMFKREKDKLKEELSVVKGRISLTSDCWTSITTDGYMSLTAHFVDNQWNLQKKIMNFRFLPPPHTGVHMSDHVYDFLKEWRIQKKIMCITLDNASSNDVFADVIKNELDLVCGGDYFHVRCCAHILNLIVQDRLKEINEAVVKVRETVKYCKGSQARKQRFLTCVAHVELDSSRGLRQDVPTRWNSTYLMLENVLYYKKAFLHFQKVDANYIHCPTNEEWGRIEKLFRFLKELENSDNFMHKMAARMYEKFAQYWTNFSIIMAVAVVLDPRFKYEFVEWAFKKVYGEIEGTNELVKFKERLDYLYGAYVTEASTTTPRTRRRSSRQPNEDQVDVASDSFMMDFDNFSSSKSYVAAKSDLQIYLEEPLIPPNMDPQLQDLCGKIMAMKVNDDVGDTPSPSPPQSAPESPAVMESQT